jgi:hypothetical protein
MISEAYVSFETAKLLKEKGFNEECFRFYMPTGNGIWKYEHYHDFDISDRIECPTQQMAMKWLREVHSLFICIEIGVGAYVWSITDISNNNVILKLDVIVGSYEETVEAALKYSLENLI